MCLPIFTITNLIVVGVECESYKAFEKGECDGNFKIFMGEKSFDFAHKLDGTEKKFYLVTQSEASNRGRMRYMSVPQIFNLKDMKLK